MNQIQEEVCWACDGTGKMPVQYGPEDFETIV
jgi:hypothetical protein